jgi:flagellar export protein FliJ
MAFHFTLAAVLRYRETIEQRECHALERIQQELARVELQIRQNESDSSAAMRNRVAELTEGVRAVEMQAAYEYQKALEQQREVLRARWQELKVKWRQQLKCYELARRNLETLDKLRQKQLEVYCREQAKQEQAMIDDLFLSRRRRSN